MGDSQFHMIDAAPTPVGPFCHAVESDGLIVTTGQMPTDPDDDTPPLPEGVEAQTRRVMDNLVPVLDGIGLTLLESMTKPHRPDPFGPMRLARFALHRRALPRLGRSCHLPTRRA